MEKTSMEFGWKSRSKAISLVARAPERYKGSGRELWGNACALIVCEGMAASNGWGYEYR